MPRLQSNSPAIRRSRRIIGAFQSLAFLFAFFLAGLVADSAEGDFRVERGKRELPEIGTFPECVIWTKSTRVAVLVPPNCTGDPECGEKRLKLQFENYKGFILLEFTSQSARLASPENEAGLLRVVQDRFPDCSVHPAGRAYVGNLQGLAFDIERVTPFKTSLTTRLAFVATPEGVLEISMTTDTSNFPGLRGTFVGFLGAVQIQPIKPGNR